jgi:hypothetical protein
MADRLNEWVDTVDDLSSIPRAYIVLGHHWAEIHIGTYTIWTVDDGPLPSLQELKDRFLSEVLDMEPFIKEAHRIQRERRDYLQSRLDQLGSTDKDLDVRRIAEHLDGGTMTIRYLVGVLQRSVDYVHLVCKYAQSKGVLFIRSGRHTRVADYEVSLCYGRDPQMRLF